MAHVFRYPLTRFCLKSGTLTLPRTMVGLFPESSAAVVIDTITDEEFTVSVENARTVSGFSGLFKRHQLAVNDELTIEALADGRFAVTATAHKVEAQDVVAPLVRRVLDEVFDAEVPVTEGEVRALFPDLPAEIDVAAALEGDGRFVQRRGRWQSSAAVEAQERAAEATEAVAASVAAAPASSAAAEAEDAVLAAVAGTPTSSGAAAGGGAIARQLGALAYDDAAMTSGQHTSRQHAGGSPTGGHQAGDASAGDSARVGGQGSAPWSVFERRTPHNHEPRPQDAGEAVSASDADDDGASLEATELANRLRTALTPLGFRIEPLGKGQLNVHADMGRRGYRVLMQLLSRTERLDWADLLARRRTSGVKYLAVVGDHRDLLRLTNPADLARATLWSWQALDRMSLLHRSVPLSPIELEAHFDRDGLFEKGLERLESTVALRVAERGAMSEVLARLAVMRSPSVFLLEDLAGELGMSRELMLRILERLTAPPFHLVAKVDAGEFVLRQGVGDALNNVAEYASSLRARLPVKQVERLVASGEPDLLTDSDGSDQLFGAGAAEA